MRIRIAAVVLPLLAVGAVLAGARRSPSSSVAYRYANVPVGAVDLDEELSAAEARVARAPDSGLELANLAGLQLEKARRSGDATWFEKADGTARRSLEMLPVSNRAAKSVLAEAAEARHRFGESMAIVEELLREKPDDAGALLSRATSRLALGDPRAAEDDADRAIARVPGSRAYALRGLALEAQGRLEEARRDLEVAIEVEEPGDRNVSTWCRSMLGRLHLRQGRLADARASIDSALAILPEDATALALLAEIEHREGHRTEALSAIRTAYTVKPEPVFLLQESKISGDREPLAFAEKILRTEVVAQPSGHRLELAKVLLEKGGDATEARTLAEAELRERRDADTLATVAEARLRCGDARGARDAIREALRSGVRRTEYWEIAARVENAAGNPSRGSFYATLAGSSS